MMPKMQDFRFNVNWVQMTNWKWSYVNGPKKDIRWRTNKPKGLKMKQFANANKHRKDFHHSSTQTTSVRISTELCSSWRWRFFTFLWSFWCQFCFCFCRFWFWLWFSCFRFNLPPRWFRLGNHRHFRLWNSRFRFLDLWLWFLQFGFRYLGFWFWPCQFGRGLCFLFRDLKQHWELSLKFTETKTTKRIASTLEAWRKHKTGLKTDKHSTNIQTQQEVPLDGGDTGFFNRVGFSSGSGSFADGLGSGSTLGAGVVFGLGSGSGLGLVASFLGWSGTWGLGLSSVTQTRANVSYMLAKLLQEMKTLERDPGEECERNSQTFRLYVIKQTHSSSWRLKHI